MKRCEECKINVLTSRITCPLCFKTLKDDGSSFYNSSYPKRIIKKGKNNLFYKIVLFTSFLACIITFLINFLTYNESWWCLYVIVSSLYFYAIVHVVIFAYSFVVKKLFIQMVSTSIIIYLIDYFSGNHSWSVAYVIPSICTVSNISIGIMTIADKNGFSKSFNSLIGGLLFGTVPFIFQIFNLINLNVLLWAPMVSSLVSLTIILALLVFYYQETIEELKKRFHL